MDERATKRGACGWHVERFGDLGHFGTGCSGIELTAAPGQVLAQRQQEVSTQSVHQVSEVLRGELSAFKDTQNVQVRVLR